MVGLLLVAGATAAVLRRRGIRSLGDVLDVESAVP
jgi:hypothetical protein